jgi:putative spermidine/putrescine transport system substrate-binding protein
VDSVTGTRHAGNFNPAVSTPAGIESGQIKVALSWSFLNTGWASINSSWKTVIPQDAPYIGYYAQAVCANASHPAAARLWQEFLYSPEGQNLWIKGGARPVLIDALLKSGDIDQQAYNALPPVTGKLQFPNAAQQARAQATINANWSKDVGSA